MLMKFSFSKGYRVIKILYNPLKKFTNEKTNGPIDSQHQEEHKDLSNPDHSKKMNKDLKYQQSSNLTYDADLNVKSANINSEETQEIKKNSTNHSVKKMHTDKVKKTKEKMKDPKADENPRDKVNSQKHDSSSSHSSKVIKN